MRMLSALRVLLVLIVISPSAVFAQSSPGASPATVPRLINISGVFRPADGQPAGAVATVTLLIYADPEGGAPLWQETQTIALDGQGRYSLLLGASQPDGIPAAVFGSGDAQWLGTVFERAGEVERARLRITSVPYALRASDADTLGGRPASDYLLTTAPARDGVSAGAATVDVPPGAGTNVVLPGTDNVLAKYTNGGADIGNSAVYEAAGSVGIGTTAPLDTLHVRFNSPGGGFTGYAVQNTALSPTAYSGMLFYDQAGALSQFQGFNNSTHEYRINNIARVSPGGAFNGSINFMVGGTSRFLIASNGNIGIGTTAPAVSLEVSNALTGLPTGDITASTYSANGQGSVFSGRKARGSLAAPTAVQVGDNLAIFRGFGYGTTTYGAGGAAINVRAAENWTDTAQATSMSFMTTATGTAAQLTRMMIDPSGNLGIGTGFPTAAVEVVRDGGTAEVRATSYGALGGSDSIFTVRTARGTSAVPSAVQLGDNLGGFGATGYGATGFGEFAAGMGGIAAENWTNTAQGAALMLASTPLGSDEADVNMIVLPTGNVGIGLFLDIPVITDKLQVFGDIRVGTTGTNGCLKDFGGNPLAGTCASDRRFKKDITPFGHVLDRLTALQPVHYFWRASEFPDRQFGHRRAYGLIAQDVEQVLPELVVTNDDGFKAVDYSELPLLTIQAVKELKVENDALKQRVAENDSLKHRVAELERLVNELLATAPRR